MATNKSCPKDEFDWPSYKKASRRLSGPLEEMLLRGHLRPVLDYVQHEPEVRFDIRPGKANLYYDGGSLLRLEGGARTPLRGIFDLGYMGGKGMDKRELGDAASVAHTVALFDEHRRVMLAHRHEGHMRDERRYQQCIARANDGRALADAGEFIVIDIEYAYARRVFDLVCFERSQLPRPRLVLVELKARGAALNGTSGLRDHAIDFAELLCAEGGRHVELVRQDLAAMIAQKMRLGLLAPDLGFEGFSAELPEFLVAFAAYDVAQAGLRAPLAGLRTELERRLGDLELLRFADFPTVDDGSSSLLRLRREDLMDSLGFDAYRERAR